MKVSSLIQLLALSSTVYAGTAAKREPQRGAGRPAQAAAPAQVSTSSAAAAAGNGANRGQQSANGGRPASSSASSAVASSSAKAVATGPLGEVVATSAASSPSGISGGSTGVSTAVAVVNSTLSTSADAKANPNLPNSPQHRGNWLPGYDINTDTDSKWPNTGVVRKYEFHLQNMTMYPDGTARPMLVFNGQYPGPVIEGNWGDEFEITVYNDLQHNGTSLHWHGLRLHNNNIADGTNGITECPIPPGGSNVYKFQAVAYGTSWYHSHFSVQYGDGAMGPIVIHGPTSANYDIDIGSVMISEIYKGTAFQTEYSAHRTGATSAANYLMNGKNAKPDLSAGTRPTWNFTPGKKHLIRLLNAGIDAHFKVSIDNHKMTVISNDNNPIVPYVTDHVSLGVGQRMNVIVEANQPVGKYFFRAASATACCSNANAGTGQANGIIAYAGATSNNIISNPAKITTSCNDETLANQVPIVQKSVDKADFIAKVKKMPVTTNQGQLRGGDNVFLWYINGVSMNADWNSPILSQAVTGNTTYAASTNIIVLPEANVMTYWIVQDSFFVPHPMHLHGHDFYVLGQGSGTFNVDADTSKLNFKNPPRRDVTMLAAQGWTVIAFKTDNPGAWLLHCHVAWHAAEGMSIQFLERPKDIISQYKSYVNGPAYTNLCAAWNKYASGPIAYQKNDSGLKKRLAEEEALMKSGHLTRHARRHLRK